MRELYRSNNPVELSYLSSLLEDAGIVYLLADQFTSVMEGSIGAIQRRILVDVARFEEAESLLARLEKPHE